ATDAAATDAAATDAAATDAAATDAGTVSNGPRATLSLGASCDGTLSDSAEAMPNAAGELKLCLSGDRTGAAQIALSVPGVLRVAHADEAQIILRTQTLSVGRHRLINEGQPQLTCDVGGALEQPLTLRVIDSAEPPNPVPGIEVETSHSGMESVSPAIAISGPDGSLRITGLCPQQRRSETTISAELVVDRTQRIVQPVEVQIGAVAQIIARLENSAPADPWALRIAEVRVLNIELRDERSNTVPQGALSFDLQQAFRALLLLDEPACGAAADASLHALTCIADGAGQIRLRIKAAGILPGEIVNLDLRGHRVGDPNDPHLELPLALSTGVPVSLAINPAREMLALVGSGNGDRIWARIADAGGNGVAGVVVTQREMRLNEDQQLVPQQNPAVTLALSGEGRSDAEGRVLWEISQISRPNDNGQPHQLEFNAVLPGGNRSELLRVSTERGSAVAFVLRDLSGDEVPAVEGAWVFNGDAGTALIHLHNLTLVNARGGLVQDQLGLAVELSSRSAIGCSALSGLSAATFEDGIIPFGGNAEVEFNFGQAVRSCLYRLSVGEVSHALRLEQNPGQPSGGRFEVNIGSVEAPVWRAVNNNTELLFRPGFSQHPQAQPFSQRYDLRVLNPSDAFGNALVARTTLQP
ncbi:MAG: hypothetical protein OSB21_13865, partial [Myxococcota bacterium]|nr:hypothetical protein [Myxococcota bacterium]